VERLETPRRPRFDHVRRRETRETDKRAERAHRQERERDQHADHFVDHHRSRIAPGLSARSAILAPQTPSAKSTVSPPAPRWEPSCATRIQHDQPAADPKVPGAIGAYPTYPQVATNRPRRAMW
jgi:hypothetical protein